MTVTSFDEQRQNQQALEKGAKALASVLGAINIGGKDGLADVGLLLLNRVRRVLSTPGTGRTYRRRSVEHRASSPGNPPAVDTGKYRASWNWKTGTDSLGEYVEVGTNDKRGPWLEHGTRRMRPRPHIRRVVNEARSDISRLIAQGVVRRQREVAARLPKEIE